MKPHPRTTDLQSKLRKKIAGNTAGAFSHSPLFSILLNPFHFEIISVSAGMRMFAVGAWLFAVGAKLLSAGAWILVLGAWPLPVGAGAKVSGARLMAFGAQAFALGAQKKSLRLNLIKKGILSLFWGLCIVDLIYNLTLKF